jgi:hypothetical protein
LTAKDQPVWLDSSLGRVEQPENGQLLEQREWIDLEKLTSLCRVFEHNETNFAEKCLFWNVLESHNRTQVHPNQHPIQFHTEREARNESNDQAVW